MPVIQDILNRLGNAPGIAQAGDLERRVAAVPVPDWLIHAIGVTPPGVRGPVGHQNVGQFVGNWMGSIPIAGPTGMLPRPTSRSLAPMPVSEMVPQVGDMSRRGFLQQAGRAAVGAGAALAGGGVVGKMLKKAGPEATEQASRYVQIGKAGLKPGDIVKFPGQHDLWTYQHPPFYSSNLPDLHYVSRPVRRPGYGASGMGTEDHWLEPDALIEKTDLTTKDLYYDDDLQPEELAKYWAEEQAKGARGRVDAPVPGSEWRGSKPRK